MAQHTDVAAPTRQYTRTDFAALRFRLLRLDGSAVWNLYSEEVLHARGIHDQGALNTWLDELRDHLVERAKLVNPHVSQVLDDARRRGSWPKSVLDFIIKVGEEDRAKPKLTDGISVWFRPIVFKTLENEGLRTLQDLKHCIELRGAGWYRPIPRLGSGKARAIEHWFKANSNSLGVLNTLPEIVPDNLVTLSPDGSRAIVPLEQLGGIVQSLDGSQGVNRNPSFCLISARNDLEAVRAYLYRFRGRDKTYRAYQKELERFLLWCVSYRRIALSSVLTDECEAYKDFLAKPDARWIAPKTLRSSPRWRPFAGPLSPESQRYAVQAIRTFFEWLVRVRYLGGNPWVTVADPVVEAKELEMDIDKALPQKLWAAMTEEGGLLDRACNRYAIDTAEPGALYAKDDATPGAQFRLARAAIFLLGYSGIRREELAGAKRDRLKPVPGKPVWELAVLGKRKKWRTVYVPERVVNALRAHWADRSHEFEDGESPLALLSPVVVPIWAHGKHLEGAAVSASLAGSGFTPDGIYKVVKRALLRLAADKSIPITDEDRQLLKAAAPHAFRHTFATQAAAKLMPLDVLQRLLGHTSQQTTSIYVQAERERSIDEAARFFGT
ncbi:site-specific integrase [Burkholderia multivorans]|uniref:phage integrase family protein n=1 Tax=Burkholderia multivorans TaxID=87883 RepID=UPI001C21393D|nr:phage integrase family protein [Burkholderia multivorans]MBU9199925.1 site-specific integrase [Burkholderia multivorans]MDN8078956.1 phage integrase family protein [Burkholderia multivorans]